MISAMDVPSMHKEHARKSAAVFILTCSTSKAEQKRKGLPVEDPSGDIIEKLMREAGHRISGRTLIPDRLVLLRATVRKALKSDAGVAASWMSASATTVSNATPGAGQPAAAGPVGAYVSEFSDALGTGNYAYEFVEVHFDRLP